MGVGVEDLFRGRPASPANELRSGRITKVDASGVWCTVTGGDTRHPIGPCLGATHRPHVEVACPDAAHTHPVPPLVPLPVGARVLFAVTDDGPWIVRWEQT